MGSGSTVILQAAQRPRRDALVETEMGDAAGGATIAAASALTVKHLLDERAFQLLYSPFESLVAIASLWRPGAQRTA